MVQIYHNFLYLRDKIHQHSINMISFPCSKINIGLNIVRRREDGYHDLQSIFVPIGWTDILEAVKSRNQETSLTVTGNRIDCPMEKNLVIKALRAVENHIGRELPPVEIFLRKIVPDGAGLGGGSADAASMVKFLDELFGLSLTESEMREICSKVGADCPFFISGKPMLATGTGTTLSPIELPQLKGKKIVVAKPPVLVSTREAYTGVKPSGIEMDYREMAKTPIEEWKNLFVNDFEKSIFPSHQRIAEIKDYLYKEGAMYASMTGSGSSVYGIFENDILAESVKATLNDCIVWSGTMD